MKHHGQNPMQKKRRAVLLANGELYDPDYARGLLREEDLIVAANGGTRVARMLDRAPDVLVGDSDSLPQALQEWVARSGTVRHLHPRDKDATDLELALWHAIEWGADSLLLLGATGSRVDHTLANISLLALAYEAHIETEVVVERQHLCLVREQSVIQGEAGLTISLLPWGGDVMGLWTEGLVWELQGERLPFGPSRGISNVMRGDQVRIRLEQGMLLVVVQRGEVR